MKKQTLIFLVIIVFIPAMLSAAETPRYDIKVGIGLLSGDTTYQIGGKTLFSNNSFETIHFPLSELEFPINTPMLSISGSMEFSRQLSGSIGLKVNAFDNSGKLKDSDWGVWHIEGELPHNGSICDPSLCTVDSLDIYSESDTSLDAVIFDINLRYKVLNYKSKKASIDLFLGTGYKYENFDYSARNLDQWYPSFEDYFGFDFGHEYESGVVLRYDITYHIIFIETGASFELFDKFELDASIGYSPLVYVRDRDNHVLRGKISEGDLDGHAIFYSLNLKKHLTGKWFFTVNVNYTDIKTEGKQKQYFSDSFYASIDEEVTSHQTSAFFNIGYSYR